MSNPPNRRTAPATITLLDRGCEFTGKLSFEGVVRVDGVFQGEIYSQDHLIIGEGAVVEGDIQVGELEISGSFKGKVVARDRIVLHSSAVVKADIQAKDLEVARGAVLDGRVEMTALRESLQNPEENLIHFVQKRGSLTT